MSGYHKSAGAGSPVLFLCPMLRRIWPRYNADHDRHVITLTGRSRPYRAPRYSALGLRSTTTAREYECSCGHRGWSNHVDLARIAGEDPR